VVEADVRNFTKAPYENWDKRFYCKIGERRYLKLKQDILLQNVAEDTFVIAPEIIITKLGRRNILNCVTRFFFVTGGWRYLKLR
jgi:hypothetical protein